MTHSTALTLARDALTRAKRFIANGRECGYIRMPDADCPDPAHETPGKIDDALAAIDAELAASADAGRLAEEAKQLALCIFGDGDVRSDLRELNERIEALAALARPAPATTAPVSAQGDEVDAARFRLLPGRVKCVIRGVMLDDTSGIEQWRSAVDRIDAARAQQGGQP